MRRCYAGSMDGFVPTIYDPAVRDIRLLARAVAHHLQLSEGALRNEEASAMPTPAGKTRRRSPCCCSCWAGSMSWRCTSTRRGSEMRDGRGRPDARLRREARPLRARRRRALPVALRPATHRRAHRAARLQRGRRARDPARLQHHRRHAGPSRAGCGARALERDALHPRQPCELRSLPPGHRGQAGRRRQPAEGLAAPRAPPG